MLTSAKIRAEYDSNPYIFVKYMKLSFQRVVNHYHSILGWKVTAAAKYAHFGSKMPIVYIKKCWRQQKNDVIPNFFVVSGRLDDNC